MIATSKNNTFNLKFDSSFGVVTLKKGIWTFVAVFSLAIRLCTKMLRRILTVAKKDQQLSGCCIKTESKANFDCGFIDICDGIFLSLFESDLTECMAQLKITGKFALIPLCPNQMTSTTPKKFGPSSLAEIYRFDAMLRAFKRQNPSCKIVVCAGIENHLQAKSVFLMGCHLIMTHGMLLQDPIDIFWRFFREQV